MERFWSKVRKTPGCWEWTSARTARGYGSFWLSGRSIQAHRLAWTLTNSQIPEGMLVCHRCDNPSCVRPDHLFLGTDADNAHDRDAKGRLDPNDGEKNGYAKLTNEAVRFIRANYVKGSRDFGTRALGRKFSVSGTNIGYIVSGKHWTHLL